MQLLKLLIPPLPSQKLNSLLVQLNDARTMGSYAHLRKELPDTLTNIPIASVRRFSRHCFRFMDGYSQKLNSLLVQLNDARTMGSYAHLRKELPDTLTNIPIASVRRFPRHCFPFYGWLSKQSSWSHS